VADMVQTQIMHNHGIPVTIQQLSRHMPCHVIVHFGEILHMESTLYSSYVQRDAHD
jgi:hypothetical protein